jgi:hypothetical protein
LVKGALSLSMRRRNAIIELLRLLPLLLGELFVVAGRMEFGAITTLGGVFEG